MLKVLIADDHDIIVSGLKIILEQHPNEFAVVSCCSHGQGVMDFFSENTADVYVLDIGMPHVNGLEVARHILHKQKGAKIVLLSMHDTREYLRRALALGVQGYVLKDRAAEELVDALHAVAAGEVYFSPKIRAVMENTPVSAHREEISPVFAELTDKERQVLQMIAEGKTSTEIGELLAITEGTVNVHKKNVMRKLDLHRQADLVRFAIKEGLVIL
jgi:RNA polymerase sigma factor (sigma-70 family)